ncbi:YkgJ family cysteine cluster protein [Vallitalea guaymasensis]|uniref:YkgJ family cysteine cluster protein n=1 Tax=Vallitalea guaymasensis TaxID=1185412 RepID=UPI000DE52786|nr:YkgJ family cysteine cluster protein [Vallitalea guaymasensis]
MDYIIQDKIDQIIKESAQFVNNIPNRRNLPKSPNPLILSKWVANEIEEINNQINQIELNNNLKCVCTKGCTACCRQPIAMASSQAIAIKPYVNSLTKSEQDKLYTKIIKTCNQIEDSGIETNINKLTSENAIDNYLKEYFSLNICCPMLNDQGECSIYQVRPSVCWSYRAYGDPTDCEISHDIELSIKYDDWSYYFTKLLYTIKKPTRDKLKLLPYFIRDILENKI